MAHRIVIDRARCTGTGNCAFIAPGIFDVGDDCKASIIDPYGEAVERLVRAVEGCPNGAITVEQDDP